MKLQPIVEIINGIMYQAGYPFSKVYLTKQEVNEVNCMPGNPVPEQFHRLSAEKLL